MVCGNWSRDRQCRYVSSRAQGWEEAKRMSKGEPREGRDVTRSPAESLAMMRKIKFAEMPPCRIEWENKFGERNGGGDCRASGCRFCRDYRSSDEARRGMMRRSTKGARRSYRCLPTEGKRVARGRRLEEMKRGGGREVKTPGDVWPDR